MSPLQKREIFKKIFFEILNLRFVCLSILKEFIKEYGDKNFSNRYGKYFVSNPESKIHPNNAHKSVQLALAPLQP